MKNRWNRWTSKRISNNKKYKHLMFHILRTITENILLISIMVYTKLYINYLKWEFHFTKTYIVDSGWIYSTWKIY